MEYFHFDSQMNLLTEQDQPVYYQLSPVNLISMNLNGETVSLEVSLEESFRTWVDQVEELLISELYERNESLDLLQLETRVIPSIKRNKFILSLPVNSLEVYDGESFPLTLEDLKVGQTLSIQLCLRGAQATQDNLWKLRWDVIKVNTL